VNRRSFLSMMGFVAPAVIVKPTYFFAPRDGWGIKIYSTISEYADYVSFPDIYLWPESYPDRQLIGEMSYRMAYTIDKIVASGGGQ
jgi:hypothetical protein